MPNAGDESLDVRRVNTVRVACVSRRVTRPRRKTRTPHHPPPPGAPPAARWPRIIEVAPLRDLREVRRERATHDARHDVLDSLNEPCLTPPSR